MSGPISRGVKRAERSLHSLHPARNPLPTIGGIMAGCGGLALIPGFPPQYAWIPLAVASIGGVIVGVTARQANVSSEQMQIDPCRKSVSPATDKAKGDL